MQGVYNIWMHLTVSRVAGLARAPNPDAAVAAGRGLDGGQVSREDNAQREGEYQSVVSARAPCSVLLDLGKYVVCKKSCQFK